MKQRVVIYTLLFFPCNIVEKIKGDKACQAITRCFEEWGLPQRIKIDNGIPLANVDRREIPTLTQLWWIGLGIEVHLNNFHTPQQNGTVEGLQGIGLRWSSPHQYDNIENYQTRINATSSFQREDFRIRKLGDKTRKELYPQLWTNPRKYRATKFCIKKVHDNLSQRVWQRVVGTAGSFKFWKMQFYIGKQFANQKVTITFDPIKLQWMVRTTKGQLLKTNQKMPFTKKLILQHAGISKNF